MAKTQKQYASDLIADAITQVEKDGPLDNLGLFYASVAEAYNKSRGKLPPMNSSAASIQIKKLKLNHKTQAGKRGRAKGVVSEYAAEDDILLPITEWENQTVKVGKYAGTETKVRHTIRFDARQWVLARETDSAVVPLKYCVSFRLLLPCIDKNLPELNIRASIDNITHALRTRMGLPLDGNTMEAIEGIVDADYFDKASLQEIGEKIDKAFNANFYWNDDLRNQLRSGTTINELAVA